MTTLPLIPLLMGPTASGKTALSLRLAERLDCEIISVDSTLVYRGLDIGSAKPAADVLARVPHHLIDIADPSESYSVARFRDDALAAIEAVRGRGRLPLLVGGTMLYFRALTQGLSDLPAADDGLRQRLTEDARLHGWPALHRQLAEHDPLTAARLHPNDSQRIARALEVYALTGKSISELQRSKQASRYQWLKIALAPPDRGDLHRMIEQRFHAMISAGFVDEVAHLYRRGDLHAELPAIRAVGYRQVWRHLQGELTLAQAIDSGIAATRQFAKRQLTWLRSETDLTWVDALNEDASNEVLEMISSASRAAD